MILHLVNQSPHQNNNLKTCLRFVTPNDSILLIENGVYGALENTPLCEPLNSIAEATKIYALEVDVLARGLGKKLLPYVQLIDYENFVELTTTHHTVQSWL